MDLAHRWRQAFSFEPDQALDQIALQYPDILSHLRRGMDRAIVAACSMSMPVPVSLPYFEFPEGAGSSYEIAANRFASDLEEDLNDAPSPPAAKRCHGVSLELAISFLSRRTAVIPLFPNFYLTPRRAELGWHVIALARQVAFGIVFEARNQDLLKVVQGKAECTTDVYPKTPVYSLRGESNFFSEIVRAIDSRQGKIYCREGYVQNEIIFDAIATNQNPIAAVTFGEIWESVPSADEGALPIFPRTTDSGKMLGDLGECCKSAVAFDVGNLEVVNAAIDRTTNACNDLEYHICVVEHPINVPVGFGFSDLSLPYLLAPSRRQPDRPVVLSVFDAMTNAFFIESSKDWLQHFAEHGMAFDHAQFARLSQSRKRLNPSRVSGDQGNDKFRSEDSVPPINISLSGPSFDIVAWTRWLLRTFRKRDK